MTDKELWRRMENIAKNERSLERNALYVSFKASLQSRYGSDNAMRI